MKLPRSSGFPSVVLWFLAAVAGCGTGGGGHESKPGEPVFPSNYRSSYALVYDCRQSADHSLMNVRMFADETGLEPYQARDASFPEGAVVLKEQYDIGDSDCEGDIQSWTVMQKLADGSSPDTLDWRWQTVDADRNVSDQDASTCTSCHSVCGLPPDGYEGTCTIP